MEADNIIKNVDMYDLGFFLVNQGLSNTQIHYCPVKVD